MEPGLYIFQIAITYYRAVTLIGWLRRKHGDEYELVEPRVITRIRGTHSWNGIQMLADAGPGKDYKVYPPGEKPRPMHRLLMPIPAQANEKAWAKDAPRPKNWEAA